MDGLVMSDDFETITGSIAEAFTRHDAFTVTCFNRDAPPPTV